MEYKVNVKKLDSLGSNYENVKLNIVEQEQLSSLIDKFLSKIMSVKTEQDVIFVLGSDHLQMNNDASFILTEHETARTNLFMILEKGKAPKIVIKPSSTLDIAPTVMSIMGWDINNFAFGRNLLSEELTLVEKYGEENFFNSLKNWRLNLWKTWIEK